MEVYWISYPPLSASCGSYTIETIQKGIGASGVLLPSQFRSLCKFWAWASVQVNLWRKSDFKYIS